MGQASILQSICGNSGLKLQRAKTHFSYPTLGLHCVTWCQGRRLVYTMIISALLKGVKACFGEPLLACNQEMLVVVMRP